MNQSKENRRQHRNRCHSTIEWIYLHKVNHSKGTLFNHSKTGGFFESTVSPVKGSTIVLRIIQCNSIKPSVQCSSCEQPRALSLARVAWCKEITGRTQTVYGVGIKYVDHHGDNI